jgi:hypothetical protein
VAWSASIDTLYSESKPSMTATHALTALVCILTSIWAGIADERESALRLLSFGAAAVFESCTGPAGSHGWPVLCVLAPHPIYGIQPNRQSRQARAEGARGRTPLHRHTPQHEHTGTHLYVRLTSGPGSAALS